MVVDLYNGRLIATNRMELWQWILANYFTGNIVIVWYKPLYHKYSINHVHKPWVNSTKLISARAPVVSPLLLRLKVVTRNTSYLHSRDNFPGKLDGNGVTVEYFLYSISQELLYHRRAEKCWKNWWLSVMRKALAFNSEQIKHDFIYIFMSKKLFMYFSDENKVRAG